MRGAHGTWKCARFMGAHFHVPWADVSWDCCVKETEPPTPWANWFL